MRLIIACFVAGLGFLSLWQSSYAAVPSPHFDNASGVPYNSRAICQRNDTYYVSEFNDAINGWNAALGGTWYRLSGAACIDGHLTYTDSQQDRDWAAWFATLSCKQMTEQYPQAFNSRAFEYGHGNWLNNDRPFTVECLNAASYFPYRFQDVPYHTRRRGLTHELGHGLHLDHDTTGVMDTCWCREISGDEVTAIGWIYGGAP